MNMGTTMNMVREIKQYQATDGTCFGTRAEAEEYEKMLQNPHFKKLQDRIEKLEQSILDLKIEVSKKSWFPDVQINRPPYQQPMYTEPLPNYTVMNQTKKDNK